MNSELSDLLERVAPDSPRPDDWATQARRAALRRRTASRVGVLAAGVLGVSLAIGGLTALMPERAAQPADNLPVQTPRPLPSPSPRASEAFEPALTLMEAHQDVFSAYEFSPDNSEVLLYYDRDVEAEALELAKGLPTDGLSLVPREHSWADLMDLRAEAAEALEDAGLEFADVVPDPVTSDALLVFMSDDALDDLSSELRDELTAIGVAEFRAWAPPDLGTYRGLPVKSAYYPSTPYELPPRSYEYPAQGFFTISWSGAGTDALAQIEALGQENNSGPSWLQRWELSPFRDQVLVPVSEEEAVIAREDLARLGLTEGETVVLQIAPESCVDARERSFPIEEYVAGLAIPGMGNDVDYAISEQFLRVDDLSIVDQLTEQQLRDLIALGVEAIVVT